MRNSGLMRYIHGDKKENLQSSICTSIVGSFCVLFCFSGTTTQPEIT